MEFDLIDRIRRRVHSRDDVILGIGDDAAILQVPADRQLVVSTDTLNVGVHFSPETAPADWREQKGRWDRLHMVRLAVIVAAFVLVTIAAGS